MKPNGNPGCPPEATTERMSTVAETQTMFTVPAMSCMHCEKAIKSALERLNGVEDVGVDLNTKKVTVKYHDSAISPDVLAKALAAAGYPAVE